MPVRRSDIERLSADIRRIINGEGVDLRDHREGVLSILKNDVHTLADQKNEQIRILQRDRDAMENRLADISHQLKTPLTSMMVMADLLEDAPPDKQAEFIANIRQSLERMEWLVDALLKLSKLDAGVVRFSPENVEAGQLIDLALEPLLVRLDERGQRVKVRGGAELYCDRRWTAEALTNIIKNASEYSPEAGVIVIESGKNPICAWISVTDSGSGIGKVEVAGLFRRFEGSRSEFGFGIGLPLALAIVRGQEGDIQVDGGGFSAVERLGEVPGGATFTLKFYKQSR